MTFSLTVPSVAETSTTGFRMGAKKTIYKQEWEIRIFQKESTQAIITKNGQALTNEEAVNQKGFIKFWNEFISFYNKTVSV